MPNLYNTEFTEKKFNQLIIAFKHTFDASDHLKTTALRRKKIEVAAKRDRILDNENLDNAEKYGYLLLLLRTVQKSGKSSGLPFFNLYNLSEKSGMLLEKFLLDKKSIAAEAKKFAAADPYASSPTQLNDFTQKVEKLLRDNSLEHAIQAVDEKLRPSQEYEKMMSTSNLDNTLSQVHATHQIRARL